ncbi:NitT/TauT family transport system permease protein [Cribrihabitans marinus]|uniref:NitT/TauT family transport system permease protein n=1 Tax=Cribrihabitans marinus TaxID=1227549 RepID=A0A1H6ZPJ4_9RHOB|nr:ABC transporter permease subunit [Cribrihabitans marinus]GGH30868.1 ABC transporter permease [Cribrihabitans marinus]SEJ51622.1 NitT/TauT family transport system permease protein [Cribrihabitans marinus]
MRAALPVLTVLAAILLLWYLAVAPMNIRGALDLAERSGRAVTPETPLARQDVSVWRLMAQNPGQIAAAYELDRPRLPTPQQVGGELWKTTGEMALRGRAMSKRSLIYHAAVTLRSTLWGFVLGTALGILGAVAIVYSRVVDMSLMPWAIISQTIPIVALAPMIIVLSSQLGIEGRGVPKAIIAAYLCYFPVLVGMVKGLRAPAPSQLDLLQTYSASGLQVFLKLRLPSSVPYLFTSLKIGIAASLVGTIVGELPTGAISGLGARILIGDQFGTPLAIWAALLAAALMAGALVTLLDLLQRITLKRMGMQA